MSDAATAAQRIVPGAPLPAPLSKAQKKRRKGGKQGKDGDEAPSAGAEPTAKDNAPSDNPESSLAPEPPVAESTGSPLPEEQVLLKPSPIVELVTKRLKATNKKITRITVYASTDPEKLNDDQKRILKSLPTLEAVQKELGEVKKAIEVHEAELIHELAAKRGEAERAEKARLQSAVEAAQNGLLSKTSDLLELSRARSSIANGVVDDSAFFADDLERTAFFSFVDAVVNDDGDRKQSAINGFLLSIGTFDGVTFTRLAEILQLILTPPRAPTPQVPLIDDRQQSVSVASTVDEAEAPAVAVPGNFTTAQGSFHFIQESEIDPSFDEGAEWVEKPEEPQIAAPELEQPPVVNGHAPTATPVVGSEGPTLDWAADPDGEGEELPSIEDFKASGSATPAEPTDAPVEGVVVPNGRAPPVGGQEGSTRGGRGPRPFRGEHHRREHHPRGEDHHRGGEYRGPGEHRGGFRGPRGGGGFRGDGFRGGPDRGGFRGGFRGGPPGERGSDRGGFRGPRGGDWRSASDGGRGRGRGRGGPHVAQDRRPSTPQTPQP